MPRRWLHAQSFLYAEPFKILFKRAIQALFFSQCVWFQWFTPWATFKMHWTWHNVLRSILPGSILPSLCVEYPKIKSLYPWNLLSSVYIGNHFNPSETILCINKDSWPVWLSWMCTSIISIHLSSMGHTCGLVLKLFGLHLLQDCTGTDTAACFIWNSSKMLQLSAHLKLY